MDQLKKSKIKGMTPIELIVSIGLIGIIMLLIYPTLAVFYKSRQGINAISIYERKCGRIIELIEQSIDKSRMGEVYFDGKDKLINGKGIFKYEENMGKILDKNFFESQVKEGEILFLELPKYDNGSIISSFVAFVIDNHDLCIAYYKKDGDLLKQSKKEKLIEGIDGKFIADDTIIKIRLRYVGKGIGTKQYVKLMRGIGDVGRKYE